MAVYDLSRLARNARLMLNLKHELDRRNLRLIVSNLPGSTFDDAVGKFLFGQLCQAAQFQADLDSERMIALTRTKHERGGHNGSDPFGYRTVRDEKGKVVQPHSLEIVDAEARIVRLIFDEYGQERHGSHGALAADLNARGIKRRGRPWGEKSVADILRRAPFYLGQAVYRLGEDVRPGSHDPVITPAQSHLAERVAGRRRRPGRPDRQHRTYVLQRVAFCADCGRRLRGEALSRPGRQPIRYYRCPGRREKVCGAPHVRADKVEAVVVEHLASHTEPPELVALTRDQLRRMRHIPDEASSIQRGRLQAALRRLNDLYLWQTIDEGEYQRQREVLTEKLAELPPPEQSNLIAFDRAAATLLPMGEVIRESNAKHQRSIVRHIVERVEVRDGSVVAIEPRPEARPFFERLAVAPRTVLGALGQRSQSRVLRR